MKRNALWSLSFGVAWSLYCVAVMLQNPLARGAAGFAGMAVGFVFLWGTGFALLCATARRTPRTPVLVAVCLALVAADQLTKLWVLHALPGGERIAILGGWLGIRAVPNYGNNVLFSLLGITAGSGVFHAAAKGLVLALAAVFIVWYTRREGIALRPFGWAFTLLGAGGVASMVESAYRGYIVDFVSFAGLVVFDWKDLYLMYGIGLMVVEWLRQEEKQKKAE